MSNQLPPIPVQSLQYATPAPYQQNQAVPVVAWSDGPLLITPLAMNLPGKCVKCNADCQGYWLRKQYSWHHPGLYFLILAGILVYAIVALIVRKQATLNVGLCPVHRKRRTVLMTAAWILGLGFIACLIGGGILASSRSTETLGIVTLWTAFPTLIAAIVFGVMATRVGLVPTKMNDQFAWFKGACPEYLMMFPPAR